jgi:hypothetical protein
MRRFDNIGGAKRRRCSTLAKRVGDRVLQRHCLSIGPRRRVSVLV